MEELKELREQAPVVQKQLMDSKTQITSLTMRLNGMQAKVDRLKREAERTEAPASSGKGGMQGVSSAVAMRTMLADGRTSSIDAKHEFNRLIDEEKAKKADLETRVLESLVCLVKAPCGFGEGAIVVIAMEASVMSGCLKIYR